MSGSAHNGMQAVLDRLTRQEERSDARDVTLRQMQVTLEKMDSRLDELANDLRDAKTGLRIGIWLASTITPAIAAVAGWWAHYVLGK